MTSLGDESGFILSNILSFLDLPLIYPLSSINSWWKTIIGKAYFIQSIKFSIDDIITHYSLSIDEETSIICDRLHPFSTVVEEMKMIYRKRSISKLKHLIKCMKSHHGSLKNIEILEMYTFQSIQAEDQNIIDELSELFPNIKLVRSVYLTSTVELLQRKFVNLKQLFLLYDREYTLLDLEMKVNQYPNIEFLYVKENLTLIGKSSPSLECTDENVLELIKTYPFLLNIYFRMNGTNILDLALLKNYKKTIKYLLEKKPSLLTKLYSNYYTSIQRSHDIEVLDLLFTKIEEISQKSDEYYRDTISTSLHISHLLDPMVINNSIMIPITLPRKYNIDSRLLKYQASTLSDNSPFAMTHSKFKKYSGNTILHDECHADYNFNITISNINQLRKNAFIVNNDSQNIIHFLCYQFVDEYQCTTNIQCLKYNTIKTHVPNFERLLFMENGMKRLPIHLFLESTKTPESIKNRELLKCICLDMFNYNKEESIVAFRNISPNSFNYTIFYLISNIIGMPILDQITIFNYYTIPGISVGEQIYYAFENDLVNLNPNDDGRTLLFQTIEGFVMQCFVYFGGNVNHQDENGNTALHMTHSHCTADLLLSIGADPNIENDSGEIGYSKFITPSSCKSKRRNVDLKLCKKCWKFFKNEKALKEHEKVHEYHY